MSSTADILSVTSGTSLTLSNRGGEHYLARITGANLEAAVEVYEYDPRGTSLRLFFSNLASNWRGWRDLKSYVTLEDELSVTAQYHVTGHITLTVELRSGAPEVWRLAVHLRFEAGQLHRIASDMADFFAAPDPHA